MKVGSDSLPSTATKTEALTISDHSATDVFISLHPQHADKILNGSKTVEFRRRFPNPDHITDALVWLYSSSPVKAVVAVARVEGVDWLPVRQLWTDYQTRGGIDWPTFHQYFSGVAHGFAIKLTDITSLGQRIPQSSLRQVGFHVPQSYRYVTKDVYPLLQSGR